jgi:hypothetical protein
MGKKFGKEIEVLKKMEMLEMKSPIKGQEYSSVTQCLHCMHRPWFQSATHTHKNKKEEKLNKQNKIFISTSGRLDQAEERLSGIEDMMKELLHSDSNRKTKHGYNLQDFWDMIKRPKLRIHRLEEELRYKLKL